MNLSKNQLKRERAEQKKAEKRQLKLEDEKIKEEEMWERLSAINRQFKRIRMVKKEEPKMSSTILK